MHAPLFPQMRKRSIIWFGVICAAVLGFSLVFAFSPKEPFYAGRPLSFWIDQLPARLVMTNGNSEAFPESYATLAEAEADQDRVLRADADARTAVRKLGSQCLPVLLRWLDTRSDSKLSCLAVRWGLRLHLLKPSSRAARGAAEVRGQALTGILVLGDSARVAVPELLVLARSKDPGVKLAARHALEQLAPEKLRQVRHE
jgi:hypothetical protein